MTEETSENIIEQVSLEEIKLNPIRYLDQAADVIAELKLEGTSLIVEDSQIKVECTSVPGNQNRGYVIIQALEKRGLSNVPVKIDTEIVGGRK